MAWWTKPGSPNGVVTSRPEKKSEVPAKRYDPTPASLGAVDYHYWWYPFEGSRQLQTRFFGGAIEAWREPSLECWDDVKALGIGHPRSHGLLGM